jgi:hypothetical protein
VSDEAPPTIDQIIRRTQPPTPGAYQRCLFKLARELKALPHLHDAEPAARRAIVAQWQELAESVIGKKPREDVLIDFLRGFPPALDRCSTFETGLAALRPRAAPVTTTRRSYNCSSRSVANSNVLPVTARGSCPAERRPN